MKKSELVKLLKRNGCKFERNGGSHEIWYSNKKKKEFPVPRHARELKTGTVHSILKDAGIK